MADLKLLTVSGALRREATNRKLLREAARLFGDAAVMEADLNMPLYDGDAEAAGRVPAKVQALADQIGLARFLHADGHVGLPHGQVQHALLQHQVDLEIRVLVVELGQARRQPEHRKGHVALQHQMPALVAARFNPDMTAKYKALIDAGKPPKVAITAIMRKLIILANALLKSRRKWQPNIA